MSYVSVFCFVSHVSVFCFVSCVSVLCFVSQVPVSCVSVFCFMSHVPMSYVSVFCFMSYVPVSCVSTAVSMSLSYTECSCRRDSLTPTDRHNNTGLREEGTNGHSPNLRYTIETPQHRLNTQDIETSVTQDKDM